MQQDNFGSNQLDGLIDGSTKKESSVKKTIQSLGNKAVGVATKIKDNRTATAQYLALVSGIGLCIGSAFTTEILCNALLLSGSTLVIIAGGMLISNYRSRDNLHNNISPAANLRIGVPAVCAAALFFVFSHFGFNQLLGQAGLNIYESFAVQAGIGFLLGALLCPILETQNTCYKHFQLERIGKGLAGAALFVGPLVCDALGIVGSTAFVTEVAVGVACAIIPLVVCTKILEAKYWEPHQVRTYHLGEDDTSTGSGHHYT